MSLHLLPKITRGKKRLGRGHASHGGKSGRGQKGQRARAGSHHKAGFEGGQTPLYMRLPKGRGQKSRFSGQLLLKTTTVSLGQLNQFPDGSIVGPAQLKKSGLINRHHDAVRLVRTGKFSKKLTVRVHGASAGAKEQIEKAGGKVEILKA